MKRLSLKRILPLICIVAVAGGLFIHTGKDKFEESNSESQSIAESQDVNESQDITETSGNSEDEPNYNEPESAVTERLPDIEDFGFYGLDRYMDTKGRCFFVRVEDYIEEENCVYLKDDEGDGILIERGTVRAVNCIHPNEDPGQEGSFGYESHRDLYSYYLKNNRLLTFAGGYSVLINDIKIIGKNNNAVLLEIEHGLYASRHSGSFVPAVMIDWYSRERIDDGYKKYYKYNLIK